MLVIYRGEVALFGVHLVAYIRAFPDAEYSLLPYGEEERGGQVVREICAAFNIAVVDVDAARTTSFDAIAVHSYVDPDVVAGLLAAIDHGEVWFYADMIRNGFTFPVGQDLSHSTLIHFGWILNDDSWAHGDVSTPRDVRVVPLESIRSMWKLVGERVESDLTTAPQIDEHTLLIALRYWGNTSTYQTRQPDSLLDAITELDLPGGLTSVVVKHDPRSLLSAQDVIESLQASFGNDIRVSAWQDKAEVRDALGSLDVLDLYLFSGDWLRGHFFGFDGTPNVLVGATQSHATIHWPNVGRLGAYFFEPDAVGVVREGIAWQKDIVDQLSQGATEGLSASYDGSHFRSLFESRLEFDTALNRGYLPTIVDHLASTAGLPPNPDLKDLVIRIDGLKRDRLYFDRLSQSRYIDWPGRIAEVEAAAAAREAQHLAEAVAAAAAREAQHLAEAEARYRGLEAQYQEFAVEHERTLAVLTAVMGSPSWKALAPVRALTRRGRARASQPETLPSPAPIADERGDA